MNVVRVLRGGDGGVGGVGGVGGENGEVVRDWHAAEDRNYVTSGHGQLEF